MARTIFDDPANNITLGALKAKSRNDATYGLATLTRPYGAEIEKINTFFGTGSTTAPGAANKVVTSTGATTSDWTGTPTLTTITTTGNAIVGGTAAITGNTTVGGTLGITGSTTCVALTTTGAIIGGTTLAMTGAVTHSSTTALNDDITFANAKKAIWKNAAGSADCSIVEDANDDLVLNVNTADKDLRITDDGDDTVVLVDTDNEYLSAKRGYELRAYEAADTKHLRLIHDGTDGEIEASSGNVIINPSSALAVMVIANMPRRNHASSSGVDSHIQRGWGYIQGGGVLTAASNITLPKAFSSDNYSVIASAAGIKVVAGGAPSDEGDIDNWNSGTVNATSEPTNTTTFRLTLSNNNPAGTLAATNYYLFTWIAIGPI